MNGSDTNRNKYKRPKQITHTTTNPESSRSSHRNENTISQSPLCPLLAKDSEWVDITPTVEGSRSAIDDEEVLQLVECEEGPESKPLAIMFPGLLNNPRTLQGMLNRAMSTTEVTKHLVDLGQKANFTFMKKANRLIPHDKQWLERLSEDSASAFSNGSRSVSNSSSNLNADKEFIEAIHRVKDSIHNNSIEDIPGTSNRSESEVTEKYHIIVNNGIMEHGIDDPQDDDGASFSKQ